MKKLIATAFCVALTLPTMQAMAGSNSTGSATNSDVQQQSQRSADPASNNPSGHGQEYQGSQATSGSATMDNTSPSGSETPTGRQGHSDEMEQRLNSPDQGNAAQDGSATPTGRQGHSAEMEEQVSPGDSTEAGANP